MKEEIIKMAREAGLHRQQHNLASNPVQYRYSYGGYEENLERFFHMAQAAEREACAKVCETFYNHEAKDCAEAIRARGRDAQA